MPNERTPGGRDRSWYRNGLCFSCTQCGDCCRKEPGYVWVTKAEIGRIARFLGIGESRMGRMYLRAVGRRVSLIEKPNLDCIFWNDGCTIYPVRPRQCRTFPFWPENLESEEDWKDIGRHCPGVDHGRLYTAAEIDALRAGRGETGASVEEGHSS